MASRPVVGFWGIEDRVREVSSAAGLQTGIPALFFSTTLTLSRNLEPATPHS